MKLLESAVLVSEVIDLLAQGLCFFHSWTFCSVPIVLCVKFLNKFLAQLRMYLVLLCLLEGIVERLPIVLLATFRSLASFVGGRSLLRKLWSKLQSQILRFYFPIGLNIFFLLNYILGNVQDYK